MLGEARVLVRDAVRCALAAHDRLVDRAILTALAAEERELLAAHDAMPLRDSLTALPIGTY